MDPQEEFSTVRPTFYQVLIISHRPLPSSIEFIVSGNNIHKLLLSDKGHKDILYRAYVKKDNGEGDGDGTEPEFTWKSSRWETLSDNLMM